MKKYLWFAITALLIALALLIGATLQARTDTAFKKCDGGIEKRSALITLIRDVRVEEPA